MARGQATLHWLTMSVLLEHRHAPLGALLLSLVAVASGPLAIAGVIPYMVTNVLLLVSLAWIITGAMYGWLPRP